MKPNESPSSRRHHRLAAHSGLPGLARSRRVRLPDRHRGTLCLRRPGHPHGQRRRCLVLGKFAEDGPNHCSGLPTPATPPASWPKCSRPASLSSTACGKPIGPRQASSSRSRGSSSAAPKRSAVVGLQRSELESLGPRRSTRHAPSLSERKLSKRPTLLLGVRTQAIAAALELPASGRPLCRLRDFDRADRQDG